MMAGDYVDNETLAANLVRLRKAQALTQEQAAERVRLSRNGYRDIESGKVAARAGTVQLLADGFDVPLRELLVPRPALSQVRFRSLKRMKNRDGVLYDVGRWLADFQDLETTLGLSAVSAVPELRRAAGAARSNGIPAVAGAVRRAFGLDEREPVHDLCGLLESRGIKVGSIEVQTDAFYGLSVAEADGGPAIVVNKWSRIPVEQWIHSAAHELGHLLLHLGDYDVSEVSESDQQEAEANEFASHFLMPDAAFRREWSDARGLRSIERIFKVKRIFRVSWRSVVYRVAQGLPEADRAALWASTQASLNRMAGRSVGKHDEPAPIGHRVFRAAAQPEPHPLENIDFVSDRLARLVRQAVEEGEISLGRAAEVLKVPLVEMRAWAASWTD